MEDEEAGNLLHGSIEAFDEQYDNVLLKFENIQKNIDRKQSIKFYWTFWFLIKSVIFPSIIPIIIALPLAYVYFRIEGIYIANHTSLSLIVFWVMAWIFLMDLIHLCHWFNYEEIPVISEEEKAPEPIPTIYDKKAVSDIFLSGIVYGSKMEYENYSLKSAFSIASHASSLLVPSFTDRRRSSIMPMNNNSSNMMSGSRRSSVRPDMASAAMNRASRGHVLRQSIDSRKHSFVPNPISENRSESQESDVLLDVIPMNVEFDVPDPFAQNNGMNKVMGILREESDECDGSSKEAVIAIPSDYIKPMEVLREESEECDGSSKLADEAVIAVPSDYIKPMEVLREESEENLDSSKMIDSTPVFSEGEKASKAVKRSENYLKESSNNNILESDIVSKHDSGSLHRQDKEEGITSSRAFEHASNELSSNNVLNTSSEGSLPEVPMNDIFSKISVDPSGENQKIKSSSDYDVDSNTSEPSLPEVPMNDIFSQNSPDTFGNSLPKEQRDRFADTGDYEELNKKISIKKSGHSTFNFKRRRTTIRQVVYDPFEDNTTTVRQFTNHRRSTHDDSVIKEANVPSTELVPIVKADDNNDEEEVEVIWSPLFFHMMWKFIFRWIVTSLFISLVDSSVLITLIVYPFLVIPGSLIAHMLTVTSWMYPIFVRFITSLLNVVLTEMINQFMFYSMIAPLAFIDIRFSSSTEEDVEINIAKGILKAIIFFLSRNIVKYSVIYTDRRAIQHEREKILKAKQVKEEKSDDVNKSSEKIPESPESQNASSLQVVFEDELEDLSYYGQLILALGGHGVPGWIFIFRIKDHLQFAFAAVGSLGMEALMVVSFKKFMDWMEKRKERRKKAEEKEKRKQAKSTKGPKLSKGLKRKGSITPNMAAIKGSKPKDKDKKGITVPDMANRKKTVPEPSPRLSNNTRNLLNPGLNSLRKDSSRSSIFENPKTEAMALIAATAFHEDNRRQAVERRFYMCSTYAAIIGAATIYMIFSTGDGNQKLCSYYGNVEITIVLWRLLAVLSVQFMVDWWFTLNQLMWGLPFAFTTQIETTIVHGFVVSSLAIIQSVTVLMAHERGLFGSC